MGGGGGEGTREEREEEEPEKGEEGKERGCEWCPVRKTGRGRGGSRTLKGTDVYGVDSGGSPFS